MITKDEAISQVLASPKATLDPLITKVYGVSPTGISGTHRANMALLIATYMTANETPADSDALIIKLGLMADAVGAYVARNTPA